jgi:hypothetical protein
MAQRRNAQPPHQVEAQSSVDQSFVNGAESALEAQSDWLATYEMLVTGWLHRRRAALRAAMDAVGRAPACHTATDLLALQQHWMAGSFQRLTEDFAAWNESAMMMSRLAMKHLEQAGRIPAALAGGGTADMLHVAGGKPSQR